MKIVMVVDDNVTNLNVARKALESDYKVLPMPSGDKALKFMQKQPPNLILLDIEMPEMDGFEVLEKMKELGSPFSDIPVIFLSGKDDEDTKNKGISLGAVDYIVKPFEFDVLLAKVGENIS